MVLQDSHLFNSDPELVKYAWVVTVYKCK